MKKIFPIVIIIFFSLITIFPLVHPGFFSFHDNTQVERVYEMKQALVDRQFPVRWVNDLGYGYGYPIYNFYGPFPYYVGGILNMVGFDSLFSTKLMIAISFLLSSISMYMLSRKFFGVSAGIVSSILYSFFPYHAVNLYVRGAIGELFAYSFLPLVFYSLFSLLDLKHEKKVFKKYAPVLLSGTAGICFVALSHNLSLLMLSLLLVPFYLTGLIFSLSRKTFSVFFGIVVVTGLLLASFYIIPSFFEMGYTNVASQVGGGADFKNHFVCLGQYWESGWGFGGSIPGCLDGLSFRLGKLFIILVAFSFIFLLNLKKQNRKIQVKVAVVSAILFCIALFLTLEQSKFIWEAVAYMKYIQYPWRFINFIALFGSVLVGFLIYRINKYNTRIGFAFVLLILFVTVFTQAKLFKPQFYNSFSSDFYTNKQHIVFDTSKISDEYMPPDFAKPKSVLDLPQTILELKDTEGLVTLREEKTGLVSADYIAAETGEININKAYFPAWKAYVNGKEMSITKTPYGMSVKVLKGAGTFRLQFVQTYIESLGNWISAIAFFAIFVGIIFKNRRSI